MQQLMKKLRSVLISSSRLYPYLPITREVLPNKIKRLVEDQSYNDGFAL